jgi:hypothetical protein
MRCSACAAASMIEIRMAVAGSPVVFRRCDRCDAQSWESEDGTVALGDVLNIARSS